MTNLSAHPGFETIDDDRCRVFQNHFEVVGRKWNSGILLAAMRGATRFSEYAAMIEGISDRMLSVRLRELELEGFIERSGLPTTPVLVQYRPTARARTLMAAMHPLIEWAIEDTKQMAAGSRSQSRASSGRLHSVSN